MEGWETPHTTTDVNTFSSDEEPRRIYPPPSTPAPPPTPCKLKRKMSSALYFPKKEECRSASAKPADRISLQQRTSPDPPETEIDFTNTKLYVLFLN